MIMIRKTNSSYYKAFCYKSFKKKEDTKKGKKDSQVDSLHGIGWLI